MFKEIIKSACYTEKFAKLSSELNQYAFDVDVRSSKEEIANVISKEFNVKVKSVNVSRRDGKKKASRLRRGHFGQTNRRKIAIVTLKDGEKIETV